MKRNLRTVLVAVVGHFLLTACPSGGGGGGGGGGSTTPSPPVASTTVTAAAGGTLNSTDGKATLVFPAGAVAQDTQVTITAIDPATLPPPFAGLGVEIAYRLEPSGQQFAQPVQVSFNLPDQAVPQNGQLLARPAALLTATGNTLELLGAQAITVTRATNSVILSGTLTHFSEVAMLRFKRSTDIPSRFVEVGIELLPDELAVATPYPHFVHVHLPAGLRNDATFTAVFTFDDESTNPPLAFRTDTPGAFLRLPDTNASDGDNKFRVGEYRCTGAAPRDLYYRANVTLTSVLFGPPTSTMPFELSIRFLEYTRCVAAPPPGTGARVIPVRARAEGIRRIDGLGVIDPFGLAGNAVRIAVAHDAGASIINLLTNLDERLLSLPGSGLQLAVFAHVLFDQPCLTALGIRNQATSCWTVTDFGAVGLGFPAIDGGLVSLTPVSTPSGLQHPTWSVYPHEVTFEKQAVPGGELGIGRIGAAWFNAPTGLNVSAWFHNPAFVVRGGPNIDGQLWFGDPAVVDGGRLIGTLGLDTRKIRCSPDLPLICAVSNYGGLVNVVVWDGTNAPTIAGTIPGTTNAVGIDVRPSGTDWEIVAADYINNTWTLARVNAVGQVQTNTTQAVPAGCTNPGHAIFVPGPGAAGSVVLSCNGVNDEGNSALAVIPLQ